MSDIVENGGERTILFGGSGFLGPYILERCLNRGRYPKSLGDNPALVG